MAAVSLAELAESDSELLLHEPTAKPVTSGRKLVLWTVALAGASSAAAFFVLGRGRGVVKSVGRLDDATELFAEPSLYKGPWTGKGTWYDPKKWGDGTCGIGYSWAPPGVQGTVALSTNTLHHGGELRGCGMCIKVWAKGNYEWNGETGGGGLPMHWNGHIFYVTNECPTCPGGGDIDFALADGQGATNHPGGWGVWDISWHATPCPKEANKGPIFMLDSGNNQYYVKARVLNMYYPVWKMEFQQDDHWQEGEQAKNHGGYAWHPSLGPAQCPLKVRLTMATGEVVVDTIPKLEKWVDSGTGATDSIPR